MDLVGDEYEIMAFAEVGEGVEFFFAEDSADRVVWTTEDEDFSVGFDRGFHRLDVEVQRSWPSKHSGTLISSLCVVGCSDKRRIDEIGGHHGIAGSGESVTAKVDCRDKAGKEVEPRSLALAMLAIEVIDHGFDGASWGMV